MKYFLSSPREYPHTHTPTPSRGPAKPNYDTSLNATARPLPLLPFPFPPPLSSLSSPSLFPLLFSCFSFYPSSCFSPSSFPLQETSSVLICYSVWSQTAGPKGALYFRVPNGWGNRQAQLPMASHTGAECWRALHSNLKYHSCLDTKLRPISVYTPILVLQ